MAEPYSSIENSGTSAGKEEAMKKRKSPPKSPISPLVISSSSSSNSSPSDDERLTQKPEPSTKTLEETIRMSVERAHEEILYRLNNPPRTIEIPILEDDQHLDPTQYYQKRLETLAALRFTHRNPYAKKLPLTRTMPIPDFIAEYGRLLAGTHTRRRRRRRDFYLAGRIMSKVYSSEMITYVLAGFGGQIQVKAFPTSYCSSYLHNIDGFLEFHSDLRVGDYVGVRGTPLNSCTGELSIRSQLIVPLSYCLHKMPPMLPVMKKLDALTPVSVGYPDAYISKDQETCYLRRFHDLTLNSEGEVMHETQAKVVSYIRHFLNNLGFLEVDSPTLTMVLGGADARSFMTRYNDLNMKMFMEIAPELYLKHFVGGGKERVYEIGKQFRNDGIDLMHCLEDTCEFYMVLADYKDLMQLTEQMLSGMVKDLTGGYKVAYHANGCDNNPIEIDFTPPFRRINMIEELNKIANLTIPSDISSDEASQYLSEVCNKSGISCPPPRTAARLFGKLARHFLEQTCVNPTFIMDHPDIMSRRAKSHLDKSGLTERFQLFINKFELINAYTEEHDPIVQRQRFACQVKDQQSGDGETVALDETLCVALEYGLPPIGAWVMGIDRLTMLLTDSQNIKTGNYTFPTMNPQLHHEQPINEDIVPSEVN